MQPAAPDSPLGPAPSTFVASSMSWLYTNETEMQREIEALLRAWQRSRADEERVVADIMAALADLSASRQAFLTALENASRSMTKERHPGPPPLDSVTEAIYRMRGEPPQRGYN